MSTGPTGPSTNASGSMGVTGPTGNDGPAGEVGSQGAAGLSGVRGQTGPSGTQGAVGSIGILGTSGSTGQSGSQGPTGPFGQLGTTGMTGSPGTMGQVGPTGSTGPTGLANGEATGPTGSNGTTGSRGATGHTGPNQPIEAQGLSLNVFAATGTSFVGGSGPIPYIATIYDGFPAGTYNTSTATFTAPYHGLYMFAVAFCPGIYAGTINDYLKVNFAISSLAGGAPIQNSQRRFRPVSGLLSSYTLFAARLRQNDTCTASYQLTASAVPIENVPATYNIVFCKGARS